MRLLDRFSRPTEDARKAADNFTRATGLYAKAVGRRVDTPPLSIPMANRIAELFDADNNNQGHL
jgi:hypothetical protein